MRVHISTDVALYGECLGLALAQEPDISVVGVGPCRVDGAVAIARMAPDALLVDMCSAQPLRFVAAVSSRLRSTHVIALSAPEREEEVIACVEAGVSAFVSAEATLADVLYALRQAEHGEYVVPPPVTATLLRRVRTLAEVVTGARMPLTARESEVLQLIERGLSNKAIAHELSIELSTVKNHVHHILEKLDVGHRAEAVTKLRTLVGTAPRD